MQSRQRITLTLPQEIISQARIHGQGNLSQFVTQVLREHFDAVRLHRLRRALEEGYKEDAQQDLALSEEFRFSDQEIAARWTSDQDSL